MNNADTALPPIVMNESAVYRCSRCHEPIGWYASDVPVMISTDLYRLPEGLHSIHLCDACASMFRRFMAGMD